MNTQSTPVHLNWFVKPLLLVLAMWLVFWLEMRFHTDFTKYGLYPRTYSGLLGIFTSPLIHSGFSHLWSNTVPIAVLLFFTTLFYQSVSNKILIYGWLLSGILTWIIARESFHIGASGLVYMLASFIFFKGIVLHNYRHIAASLVVVFLYGSLIWYVLPIEPSMSWEGHLSGAVAGLILAFTIRKVHITSIPHKQSTGAVHPDEEWFMMQFDEDGNFNPISMEEEEE